MDILGKTYKSGDNITCQISDINLQDAVISFNERDIKDGRFYICTNNPRLDGTSIKESRRYGYLYAYSVKIHDIPYFIKNIKHLFELERKDNIEISDDLSSYFNFICKNVILRTFRYKLGVFDEYNIFNISENEGMILLSNNSGKKVEVKFGRFLRKTVDKVKINLTDSEIEKLYNKYVLHQNKKLVEVAFYTGNDILKGYTKSLQVENSLSLNGSCMNDKHPFLELYTKNTNIVRLAVFRNHGEEKILARCIVWKIDEDTYVHDRIYFAHDWIEEAFKCTLSSQNIKPIYNHSYLRIQLDEWKLKHYPYMDSFNLFDKKTGCLIYQNPENISTLTSQGGGPDFEWDEQN